MRDIEGKVALVTGGVSGIGLGIAKALAGAGAKVALGYRRRDHLDAALAWFAHHPAMTVLPVRLDVTNREDWARVAGEIDAAWGKLHILCNNAGVSFAGTVDAATDDDWEWIMRVNFWSLIHAVRACLPMMRAHGEGGHIVNVTSMAAFLAPGEMGLYTTSKFAARGFTESLRPVLAAEKIGVSELLPGLTRSNINHAAENRPAEFADSAFTVDPAFVEGFGKIMEAGMDPDEVGVKTLAGIRENRPLIFSHPEFRDEMAELFAEIVAAIPDEPAPADRLALEESRRAAKRGGGGFAL